MIKAFEKFKDLFKQSEQGEEDEGLAFGGGNVVMSSSAPASHHSRPYLIPNTINFVTPRKNNRFDEARQITPLQSKFLKVRNKERGKVTNLDVEFRNNLFVREDGDEEDLEQESNVCLKKCKEAAIEYGEEGEKIVNGYVRVEKIGHGATSKVYHVRRRGQDYAMKVFRKNKLRSQIRGLSVQKGGLARLQNEIKILALINNHAHCIRLLDILEGTTKVYAVFEFCSRGSLCQVDGETGLVLQSQGGSARKSGGKSGSVMCEKRAKHHFRRLALALSYLHKNSIYHADIKPSNLLVDHFGRLKISDFGEASLEESEWADWEERTCGRMNQPTPLFMSPELCKTKTRKYLWKKHDSWAAGLVLYCILMGKHPFYHHTLAVIFQKIQKKEVYINESLSEKCREVIENLLQKDPKKRWSIDQCLAHDWIGGSEKTSEDEMLEKKRKRALSSI